MAYQIFPRSELAYGFDFKNETGSDMEAGSMVTVNNLVGVLKDAVPDGWMGHAHFIVGPTVVWEIIQDTPLGQDYKFGEAYTLDGTFMGYVVPHPDDDPTTLHDNTVVAASADTVIRVAGLAVNGTLNLVQNAIPLAAEGLSDVTGGTDTAGLEAILAAAAAAAGGTPSHFDIAVDSTAGAINVNTLVGNGSNLTSLSVGAELQLANKGPNAMSFTDPVTTEVTDFLTGDHLTLRKYTGKMLISG